MSESEQQPFGGRNERPDARPDDDTLPGERPADQNEKKVGPPGDSTANQTGRTPDRSRPSRPSRRPAAPERPLARSAPPGS